jgi:hypothetical protein
MASMTSLGVRESSKSMQGRRILKDFPEKVDCCTSNPGWSFIAANKTAALWE